jgi:xylem cysteine proteinase
MSQSPLFVLSCHSEADHQSFQFYKSGVFADPSCGSNLDHGVAAVGYGTADDGEDYFKVRNSWVSKMTLESTSIARPVT